VKLAARWLARTFFRRRWTRQPHDLGLNMKRYFLCLILFAFAFSRLIIPPLASAKDERILNFKSVIIVNPDTSLTVTENITVRSTGIEIKRGIIRDFSTTYSDRLGNALRVGFKVEKVLRDGHPEPYHTQVVANGVKIFIGEKDVYLKPGVYTYFIMYHADSVIGFFKDYDELNWNVTGNDWTFPIDRAEAIIKLPPEAKINSYSAYTGYQGTQGTDFTLQLSEHAIIFKTSRGLAPREGLTVAVGWPKGVVYKQF
jgi:hypothetical protein